MIWITPSLKRTFGDNGEYKVVPFKHEQHKFTDCLQNIWFLVCENIPNFVYGRGVLLSKIGVDAKVNVGQIASERLQKSDWKIGSRNKNQKMQLKNIINYAKILQISIC